MRKFRQKYYDLFSRVYDQFVAMHASGQEGVLKTTLAEKTGASSGDRLLDICTGTGSLLTYLSEKVGENGTVVGVDFSIGMLRAAKTKTAGCVNIHLVQADVARLPFKPKVFDAATCAHAFYELKGDSQDACLRDVRNVLKSGKPFLMMEHDVPRNPVVRFLFYIRLMSMGMSKAIQVLRREREMLLRYFHSVDKHQTASGRSKIMVCKT